MRSRPYLSSSPQAYQGLLHGDGSRESSSTSFSEFQYNILDQRNSSSLEAGSVLKMEKISYGPEDWEPEADDYLHNPSPDDDDSLCMGLFSVRALMNVGCLFVLGGALLVLFGGYPIITYVRSLEQSTGGAFNLGSVNGSGQVPATISSLGLIDDDTPESAYTMTSNTGVEWELVFSDEFNVDGRSFYSGDDPYWEANDLHAWATDDLEWYSPEAVTTANGSLVLTLSNITQHDLYYQGAEISSWNKFCFTGGRLEASVKLPGRPDVYGLWPAVWTLGNLGRVGYGGTLDGLWPYSYDSCDVGTVANQSKNGVPEGASNLNEWGTPVSYLPGQRLSRCTCANDTTHPGPKHSDGTWVGRSAPEIDLFEAQVDNTLLEGQVSQSCQFAPFNPYYLWLNETHMDIYNTSITALNSYSGGQLQQSTSCLTYTNQNCYEHPLTDGDDCYSVYAFEYLPGSDGYITWFSDDTPSWQYQEGGMGANSVLEVSDRPVPQEPMYIIINLALSTAFGAIDYDGLEDLWPVHMYVDYIRVYQDPSLKNIGCDPDDFPTAEYIALYPEGYANPNITTWEQMTDDAPRPGNSWLDEC